MTYEKALYTEKEAARRALQREVQAHMIQRANEMIGIPSGPPVPYQRPTQPVPASDLYRINTKESTLALGSAHAEDQLFLYQITIVDSRVENDDEAVNSVDVRSRSQEGARLAAMLRLNYSEPDLKYLDIFTAKASPVKSVDAEDDEDDDEDDD